MVANRTRKQRTIGTAKASSAGTSVRPSATAPGAAKAVAAKAVAANGTAGPKRKDDQRRRKKKKKVEDVDEVMISDESTDDVKRKKNQMMKASPSEHEGSESSESSESSDGGSDDDSDGKDGEGDDAEHVQESKGAFFSDENASWLKPKTKTKQKSQLMGSDDDEDDDGDDEDDDGVDDDDDDDDDDALEIERQSRLLDAELKAEREEADREMRRTIDQSTSVYHLPTPEEIENEADRVVPPSEIRARIESVLEVLADFKSRREPGRSRTDYTDRMVADMAELHGYLPELVDYFLSMLGPAESFEFVQASDRPRPLVIRTNTLRARRKDLAAALMKRGVSLDPLASWSKVGLKIVESSVPIGATPEYLSGQYMLQSAASMCPVLALSPVPHERCLDMSAAPGGKTSHMAQLMRNTGAILANDLKPERQKATVANMHRLGVRNVITCAHDGRKLGRKFPGRFDRVLLDAPCSGLGVISRDPSVKVQRTMADVHRCAHLQKELLLASIDALNHRSKTGGVMVYSTCSVSVAENEEVVNYALAKRDIKIVDTGLDFGKPGFTRFQNKRFHPSVALTRRFYPHVHNMDGFFVCKIQKLSDIKPEDTLEADEGKEKEEKNKAGGEEKSPTDEDAAGEVGGEKEESRDGDNGEKMTEVREGRRKATTTKKKKSGGDEESPKGGDVSQRSKKRKGQNMSIPPQRRKDPKRPRKLNAKVTKPRRKKTTPSAEQTEE